MKKLTQAIQETKSGIAQLITMHEGQMIREIEACFRENQDFKFKIDASIIYNGEVEVELKLTRNIKMEDATRFQVEDPDQVPLPLTEAENDDDS